MAERAKVGSLVVANEFAAIRLSVQQRDNGARLLIEDLRGGQSRYVDPLELEGLVWASESVLNALVDPGSWWTEAAYGSEAGSAGGGEHR
jgi:hypothetical protein